MKISKETLDILKNFSTINQSFLFRESNSIKTISPQKNIFAEAEVVENFPCECAIYELPKFLSVVSLFNDPDFDFDERCVTISNSSGSVRYFYASKNLIVTPPDKPLSITTELDSFSITRGDLDKLNKASLIMQLPHTVIKTTNGTREVIATNKKSASSNTMSLTRGESDSEYTYEVVINNDNIKVIPGDYTIVVGEIKGNKLIKFSSDLVTYFIATENI